MHQTFTHQNPHLSPPRLPRDTVFTAIGWLALVLTLLLSVGCAEHERIGVAGEESAPADDMEFDDIHLAEQHLENHRIDQARDLFLDILHHSPGDGTAAAGAAATQLLLMLEMDEVTELLIEHLDANGGIDANELLFAEEGYLYWAVRGVRWTEESDDYEGIRNLVADELPWDGERLQSLEAFVDGLDEPSGKAFRQLVTVANALGTIENHIETAIDDPDFVRLYIPGEVFHDAELALRIGRSELAVLRTLITVARSLIYFVAAYEHDWTLQWALGQWRHDPPSNRYKPEFQPADYTVDYLDEHLFRHIDSSDRLAASRASLHEAISYGRDAIRHGLEDPTTTTLRWEYVDEDDASEVDELLEAVAAALDGPVELPYVSPETTLDLSPLFDEGRILDEHISWFVHHENVGTQNEEVDEPEGFDRWKINDEAVRQFFLEGIIDPVPEERDDLEIEAGPDNDPEVFIDALFGPYWERVEDAYFTTR